jgi:hypothetical protein
MVQRAPELSTHHPDQATALIKAIENQTITQLGGFLMLYIALIVIAIVCRK